MESTDPVNQQSNNSASALSQPSLLPTHTTNLQQYELRSIEVDMDDHEQASHEPERDNDHHGTSSKISIKRDGINELPRYESDHISLDDECGDQNVRCSGSEQSAEYNGKSSVRWNLKQDEDRPEPDHDLQHADDPAVLINRQHNGSYSASFKWHNTPHSIPNTQTDQHDTCSYSCSMKVEGRERLNTAVHIEMIKDNKMKVYAYLPTTQSLYPIAAAERNSAEMKLKVNKTMEFHQAAFIGRLSDLTDLYEEDDSLVACAKFSNLPIHIACRSKSINNAKIVEHLINWYSEYHEFETASPPSEETIDKDSRLSRAASGKTALHIACKSNNAEVVDALLLHDYYKCGHPQFHKKLMQKQLEARTLKLKNTALHIAAYENNVEIVDKILLECSFDGTLFKALFEARNRDEDTAVHIAAARGCLKILVLLHDGAVSHGIENCFGQGGHGSQIPMGRHGWSVLHTACAYNQLEAVKTIIELTKTSEQIEPQRTNIDILLNENCSFDIGVDDVKDLVSTGISHTRKVPNIEMTPLTLACIFDHAEIVGYLLSEGAEIKKQAFKEAIDRSHEDCLRQLVIWTADLNDLIQHLSLNNMPEDQLMSTSTSTLRDNSTTETNFNESVDLLSIVPVQSDARQNNTKKESSLSFSSTYNSHVGTRLTPSASTQHGNLLSHIIQDMPSDVAESIMDRCVYLHFKKQRRRGHAGNHFQYKNLEAITMNYDLISMNRDSQFTRETHPLQTMVEKGDEKLLKHPLIASFVYNNWNSKCGLIYLMYLFIYIIFLCFTNALLFRLPNPTSNICDNGTILATALNDTNGVSDSSPSKSTLIINIFLATGMLLYSSIRLFFFEAQQFISAINKELCQKPHDELSFDDFHRLSYFRDLSNWVEVPLLCLSIAFSVIIFISSSRSFCLTSPEWQVGVTIMCLSWIELIFLSKQFHIIGIQAVTFGQVLKTIVQFLPFAFLLFAAFGLSLYLLLHQSTLTGLPFYTPYYSMLYVYTLLSGDVSTDGVFTHDDVTPTDDLEFAKHLQFEVFTLVFWCVSVLFITIVLTNVMIGLAVGNIVRVYSKADLQRLKVQINYILEVNELNSTRKLCRNNPRMSFVYDKTSETYELHRYNCWEKLKKILIIFIWGCKHFDSEKEIYPLHSRQAKLPKRNAVKRK